jgi:hypothetical protein
MRRIQLASWIVLSLVFVLLLIAASASAQADTGTAAVQPPILMDRAGGPYNGVEVTLTANQTPTPGGIVTLTLTARPLGPAPDLMVMWELPDGGTLLGGPAFDSIGSVNAGATATITRQVRFDDSGVFGVRAKALYFPNHTTSLAATGVLFFSVNTGNPTASDFDPRTPTYRPPLSRHTIDKSHLAGPVGRSPDGCFNVTGVLTRENRMPTAVVVPETPAPAVPRYTGQYQTQTGSAVPVHHILVEMREEDTFSDDSYGHTITNANGRFNFSFCDDDGFLNDELELYFRVCAEVRDGNALIARIEQTGEQELYCWDSGTIGSEGGNVDFDVTVYRLNQIQSQVFNIADAIYYGWRFWNNNNDNSPAMDRSVTINWEGGRRQQGSFYANGRTTIVIGDDPSATDEWDDSVIIHEYGHFADHQFSCYQNPGGPHSLPGVNAGATGTRLAWGEGYPNYYQSAARTIMPGSSGTSFYIDPDGPTVDLENMRAVTASDRDEGAVAALLRDLFDIENDGSDTVNNRHARIQQAYTTADFQSNAQCDMRRFLQVWRKLGLPTDAATAATIVQNVNITLASLPVLPLSATADTAEVAAPEANAPIAANAAPPFDFRWWDQTTMVIDTSSSMASPPAAPKINSVKTIIGDQVTEMAANPQGTDFNIYTFDAGSPAIKTLLEGKFFAPQVMPAVNALVANGPDAGCPVPGLGALSQAIQTKFDGEAWLYTDGDSADSLMAEQMRLTLNERRVRGSIVLLGGCGSPARVQPDVSGSERTYLGLAADGSQPTGIVPYLLTSMMSGGQFIYVAPDQLANAADMVRAQLSHTAGAGRWSDYVSTGFTYRWDRLEPWEYQWFPAESLGQDAGVLGTNGLVLDLPNSFDFYGSDTTVVEVSQDGYIEMDPCLNPNPDLCPVLSSQYLELLDTDLVWDFIPFPPNRPSPANAQLAPCGIPDHYGSQVHVFTGNLGIDEWHIISTQGVANYGGADTACRAYQAWLNFQTGEIRFQYLQLRQEAATAEIGLIDSLIFAGNNVIVSKNKLSGASNGMGYKFTPAPPQPSKSYEVEVDPLIEGVVFMQTGYSGDFAPMTVTDPDGALVDCNDTTNVRCITMHNKPGDRMVQFIQVNTNGHGGVYTATVSVGPSGNATFSFNALAASELRASSPGPHTLATRSRNFLVDLERASDNGQLQGWFQTVSGAAFGSPFTLYDDGLHNDGEAGDGRFGSDAFTPPSAGAAYLWVEGTINGTEFKRSDPTPFNFQPLYIYPPLYQEGYYGTATVEVVFWAENLHSVDHCYAVNISVPEGWSYFSPENLGACIPKNTTVPIYAYVNRPMSDETLGEVGDIVLTLTEIDDGAITASERAQVALFRPPVALAFENPLEGMGLTLRPNGSDTTEMTLNLIDDLGQIVGISNPFAGEFTVTPPALGTIHLPTGMYDNGRLPVVFTAGTSTGVAEISVMAEGGLQAGTTVTMAQPVARSLELTATPTYLGGVESATLVATVLDQYGEPVAGRAVRLSVSDDNGDKGTIGGGEAYVGVTNNQGRVTVTFAKTAGATGNVVIRAELLGPGEAVEREEIILLHLDQVKPGLRLYLPVVQR